MTKEKVELKEGHLEILSRLSRSNNPLRAADFIYLQFPASCVSDLFKWGLVSVRKDELETIGPYKLTNMGVAYLKQILEYANNELSCVLRHLEPSH